MLDAPLGSMSNSMGVLNKTSMRPNESGNKQDGGNTNRVNAIASYLVEKFNSPESWKFYCLVGNRLTQEEISSLVEWVMKKIAEHGGCAGCLFNAVARKKMGML